MRLHTTVVALLVLVLVLVYFCLAAQVQYCTITFIRLDLRYCKRKDIEAGVLQIETQLTPYALSVLIVCNAGSKVKRLTRHVQLYSVLIVYPIIAMKKSSSTQKIILSFSYNRTEH